MKKHYLLLGGSLLALISGLVAAPTYAANADPAQAGTASSISTLGEIVVTAQKREETIQSVPMSVNATSGVNLLKLGITDTSGLQNVAVGFSAVDYAGTKPTYTIRGVGFQDNFTLASSPTVSVYLDQVPQTSALFTAGDTLDVQRVEVLKGPQGTLFGENATGGAVNFVPNTPTDHLTGGVDVTYGRFNTADIRGYLSGPLTDTLDFRVALQNVQSGPWQYSYTHPATLGAKNLENGRAMLQWKPTSRFKALLTLSGFIDRSETQAEQVVGTFPSTPPNPPALPALLSYPPAPKNARAADWNSCTPTSYNSNLVNTSCTGLAKDNKYGQGSLRMDYDLVGDVVLTSLTSYEHYDRFTPEDLDGTNLNVYSGVFGGRLSSVYQELRGAGKFNGRGNWIGGVNYQDDESYETVFANISQSSVNLGGLTPDSLTKTNQSAQTYAVYGNVDYPIFDTITIQGGLRYTKQNRTFSGCNADAGDGDFALFSQILQNELLGPFGPGRVPGPPGINPGAGGCVTLSSTIPPGVPELVHGRLDQDNLSWRTGLTWKPAKRIMLYVNASQGYKAGGFPTLPAQTAAEFAPATQESLRAYEGGFKTTLLEGTLQFNGAVYYYDYTNKQVTGIVVDPALGALPVEVNIPKSHVLGFELSAVWQPVRGLTISPSISDANSRIDGHFSTQTPLGVTVLATGEQFIFAPQWQGHLDIEYDWTLPNDMKAYVGGDANYTSSTYDAFGELQQTKVPTYTLLDLRAGVERGAWRAELWGKNVTDHYYWTQAQAALNIYEHLAGMPATYGITISYRYQ